MISLSCFHIQKNTGKYVHWEKLTDAVYVRNVRKNLLHIIKGFSVEYTPQQNVWIQVIITPSNFGIVGVS